MGLVKFNGSLTQANYNALATKDDGTLYFTTDTKKIYKGSALYSTGGAVIAVAFNSSTDIFTITFADGTTTQFTFPKGAANGYASLDASGKIPTSQLPSYVDDIIDLVGIVTANPTSGMTIGSKYYNSTSKQLFTATSATAGTSSTPEADKIYVDVSSNKTYRWGGADLVSIGSDLALGETSSTAYRGDRGKTAYDHSQITGANPHGTSAAQVNAAPSSHVGAGGTTQHPLGNGTTPGFSTNDLTAALKTKLDGLANTTVENSLTSTSTTNALSAAQGKVLNDNKIAKVTTATAGEIATFDVGGGLADSNKTFTTSITASGSADRVPTESAVSAALSWG